MSDGCCEVGTYKCQEHAFTCECCGHTVWVDRCLVDEIKGLHAQGVRTLGCCCGHSEQRGYVQVAPEDVGRMLSLGYAQQEEYADGLGKWCFEPKSQLEWLRGDAE